ncbi:uveal autoantigen with coiled-coil domains and ankyrin repeats-like isoform X3 [Corticium candelabrum]|nr:uveal autoantigen with coiled-coil domains and ankyrin repeats-like isoform X3 [Corticium candelabrum]
MGVRITANKTNHQTPLHCTVDCMCDKMEDKKRSNIVRSLIAAGAEVDQQDVNGWTALKLACRSGLYECAFYLLSNHAESEKCDIEGNTALHDAVCHSTTTRLLISYVDDVDVVNYEHNTPLLLAVCSGSKEREQTVHHLVHAGADVNKENASGQFPLWLAADRKDTSIIQILLDGRADVNKAEPREKTTALHRAVINKTWTVCVLLVRHGADIDLPDAKGMTALDYAKKFHPEMAEQMKAESAEQKSKVNALDHIFLVEGLSDPKRPGRPVHVPAHSTDDDLTPDNIHIRPIQVMNSSDKPTSTAPTPSHQEVIANVPRPRLDDAPHQMLHLEEAPVRGLLAIDNPGNLLQPAEAASSCGRMHSGLDQSQLVIQQPSNLSQIPATQATLAMQSHGHQHMTSVGHQKDTGRHRQKQPSQSGNSDITRNRENVLEQLPQDQKTQADAALNCITSEVTHVTPAMQSHDTNESQQDSNVKEKATYTDELVRLRQENSQLLAQVETLRQEESQLNHQIENFMTERKQLYCTIADSRREGNEAKRNRDEKIAEIDELSDKVKTLTIENKQVEEDYQQTMDQKQKEIDALKQEKSDLQCKLGQRQQENEAVCQQLVRQERIAASLQEDKEDLQQRNQHCSRALEQAQRKLECQDICRNISEEELEVTQLHLGGGAYGEVRMGRWQGVDVAVKTFHEHLRSDLDVLVRERMIKIIRREVSICAQVCHPNVVATCGATFALNFPLRLVMELMEGSLENVIDAANEVKRYLTMREKVDLAAGCVCGLMYLHGMPGTTLHGDIRPSNVLVTLTMEAKIGDLGAARLASATTSTLISVGPLSPQYLAPERKLESVENPVHNSVEADIYSLGVTLLELFTGLGADPVIREEQLCRLSHPRLLAVTSKLLPHNPQERVKSEVALKMLLSAKKDRSYKESPPKRMVKGIRSGSQKLELVDKPWM